MTQVERWTSTTLGTECRVVSGSTPKTGVAAYWDGDVAWITPDDLSGYADKTIARGRRSLTRAGYESCSATLMPPGAVLFTSRAPIGYVAIATHEVCTNQGFKSLVPGENISSDYLYWYLRWAAPRIRELGVGTTFKEVSKRIVSAFPIVYPEPHEQWMIVDRIEALSSHLRVADLQLHRAVAKLNAVKASCFSAVTRILAAPYLDDVHPQAALPQGWAWKRAIDVCTSIDSGSTPKAERMRAGGGDVPFLKVYNIAMDGAIDFSVKPTFVDNGTNEGQLSRSRVAPGAVLMNIVGPPLGKVAVVPDTYPEWNINQAIVAFRPKPSLSSSFLAHCLRSDAVLLPLLRTGKATAGQTNLSLSNCRRLWLPVPGLNEQLQVVLEVDRYLSIYHDTIATLKKTLKRSSQLRRAILERAFAGEFTAHCSTQGSAAPISRGNGAGSKRIIMEVSKG